MGWSRYLHREAIEAGYEILDTSNLSLSESVSYVLSVFEGHRKPTKSDRSA